MHRHFEALYRESWRVAWSAARPLLPCDADADDAAQRVFARLWSRMLKSKGTLDIRHPGEFFKKAGRREALMILRERPDGASPLLDAFVMRQTSSGPTPERVAARVELRAILGRLIDELPPRRRAVTRLI